MIISELKECIRPWKSKFLSCFDPRISEGQSNLSFCLNKLVQKLLYIQKELRQSNSLKYLTLNTYMNHTLFGPSLCAKVHFYRDSSHEWLNALKDLSPVLSPAAAVMDGLWRLKCLYGMRRPSWTWRASCDLLTGEWSNITRRGTSYQYIFDTYSKDILWWGTFQVEFCVFMPSASL